MMTGHLLTTTESDDWQELMPLVDKAMAKLPPVDRDALALRFYGRHSLAEVAAALGVSEEAAKKRVSRGLEKLRRMLRSRAGHLSATALVSLLAVEAKASPPGLATKVVAAAVTGKAGTALTIAEGALKMLTLAKMKVATAVVLAVCGGAGATLVVSQFAGMHGSSAVVVDSAHLSDVPAPALAAQAAEKSTKADNLNADAFHLQGAPGHVTRLDRRLLRFTDRGGAYDRFHLNVLVQALPELPDCWTEVLIERDEDSVAMLLRSAKNSLPYAYVADNLLIRLDPENPGGVVVTEGVSPEAVLRYGVTATGARSELRVAATPQQRIDVDIASLIEDLQRDATDRSSDEASGIVRLLNPHAGGRIVLSQGTPPVSAFSVTEMVRLCLQVREMRVDRQAVWLPKLSRRMLASLDMPVRNLGGIAAHNLLPQKDIFRDNRHREAAKKLDALIQQSGGSENSPANGKQVAMTAPRFDP